MYYEVILGLFIPTVLLGALIASMIFYCIVKSNKKLRHRLATGSKASRELLYGYLAIDTEPEVSVKRTQAARTKSTAFSHRASGRAQLYDFAYERSKRG